MLRFLRLATVFLALPCLSIPVQAQVTEDSDAGFFVEFRVFDDKLVRMTVGDLRAVRSPLQRLYARESRMAGRPDFLGAAVFVDGHLLRWISGPGVGRTEFPLFRGAIRRLQIVTLDSQLRIIGNWRFDDLRL